MTNKITGNKGNLIFQGRTIEGFLVKFYDQGDQDLRLEMSNSERILYVDHVSRSRLAAVKSQCVEETDKVQDKYTKERWAELDIYGEIIYGQQKEVAN